MYWARASSKLEQVLQSGDGLLAIRITFPREPFSRGSVIHGETMMRER
jgi:hypothetical protein